MRKRRIRGWMQRRELRWLETTASRMGSVAEVGSYAGRSARALLEGCPGPVYCVDPWPEADVRAEFFDNVGHYDNLRVVAASSPGAALQVPDVDMAFIDGNHSYEAVAADIEAWLPKVRVMLCGHDFEDGWPGVVKAVGESLSNVYYPTGSIWACEVSNG